MSLVENLVEQLTSSRLNLTTRPNGFDLNDETFAKLLEKQLQDRTQEISDIQLNTLGTPAGFEIEPYDSTSEFKPINLKDIKAVKDFQDQIEIKDVNICDSFSNFIKDSAKRNNDLFNFALKNATNSYGVFGKNFVDDIKDFVGDICTTTK